MQAAGCRPYIVTNRLLAATTSLPLEGKVGFAAGKTRMRWKFPGDHAGSPLRFYGICHNFSGRCRHRPLHCHKLSIQQILSNYHHFQFSILNFQFNNSALGVRQIAAQSSVPSNSTRFASAHICSSLYISSASRLKICTITVT